MYVTMYVHFGSDFYYENLHVVSGQKEINLGSGKSKFLFILLQPLKSRSQITLPWSHYPHFRVVIHRNSGFFSNLLISHDSLKCNDSLNKINEIPMKIIR